MITEEQIARFRESDKRLGEIASELAADGVPFLTAIVMAGDKLSAERATQLVKDGSVPVEEGVYFVGSYARFDWALANLPKEKLLEMLPELWVGADPDDTNPEYLKLWQEAFDRNRKVIITDGKALPTRKNLTVYRGQVGDAVGISWTLDRDVAVKFSLNGGGRSLVTGGKVLEKKVTRKQILAYLTSRGESEVILNLDANVS